MNLTGLILKRLAAGALIVGVIAALTFVLIQLAPGDPFQRGIDSAGISPERRQALMQQHGMNDPLPIRFVRYMASVAQGDLGSSFVSGRSVLGQFASRAPATLSLMGTVLLLQTLLGIGVGTWIARSRGAPASAVSSLALVLHATPVFWLGILMIFGFALQLGWFPTGGYQSALPTLPVALDRLWHLTLPAITLALISSAAVVRFHAAEMKDQLARAYVRAARSRGVSEQRVVVRHALRASLTPVIMLTGLSARYLVTGSVLIEQVFAWPGMGRLMLEATLQRDYPVVVGGAIIASAAVVAGNIIADLLQMAVDPRARRSVA